MAREPDWKTKEEVRTLHNSERVGSLLSLNSREVALTQEEEAFSRLMTMIMSLRRR